MLQVPFAWNDVNISILKKGWKDGRDTYNIACEIGTTQGSVIGKANRLGLGKHPSKARDPDWKPRHVRQAERRKERALRRERLTFKGPTVAKLPPVVAIDPLNISFFELDETHCRYPVTENPPHLFCGHPQQDESSYCAFHSRLCWSGRA